MAKAVEEKLRGMKLGKVLSGSLLGFQHRGFMQIKRRYSMV